MTNHKEEANEWLRDAPIEQLNGNIERAMLCVGMAQAHATLALAEQQRIANLIALTALEYQAGETDPYTPLTMSTPLGRDLKDEIKKTLGVEQ